MTFLLGRHAILGHDPPIYFRSTTAVRLPSLAIAQAINLPAVPLPSTITSYSSTELIVMPRRLSCSIRHSLRGTLSSQRQFRQHVSLSQNVRYPGTRPARSVCHAGMPRPPQEQKRDRSYPKSPATAA